MFFSVIVPIYGVELYIEDCIKSIINQSYRNFELILVDDGSSDLCAAICDMYAKKDTRIIVIHQNNGGLVCARQVGVQIAKGEYTVCVDGDDWIECDLLEKFERIICNFHPAIVCAGMKKIEKNDVRCVSPMIPTGFYNRRRIEKDIFPGLIQDRCALCYEPNICSKAIETNLYKIAQLKVERSIKSGEDAACTRFCFYHANSVYVTGDCLYDYRMNHESMTKSKNPFPWNQNELRTEYLRSIIDIEEFDFQDQIYRNIVHGMFIIYISRFCEKKSYWNIRREIISNINQENIQQAIKRAQFVCMKGKLAKISLKYKLTFLMMLYSKIW